MTIQGRVVEQKTGKPLQGASILVMTKAGQSLGIGTQSGIDGVFVFSDPRVDRNLVAVSYVGEQTMLYDPGDLVSVIASIIPMQVKDDVLPGVDVHAINPAAGNQSSSMLLLFLLGVGVVAFSGKKKAKKQMAGPENYVIPVGVVIGGYFLLKTVLGKLGLADDASDASKAAADKAAADAQAAAGSAAAVNNMANRVFSDNDLKSIGVQLTDSTGSFFYDYTTMVKMLAYFARFRAADANKFLSLFVGTNGVTLYQWYRNKIANATLGNSGSIPSLAAPYKANFDLMGVDINGFSTDASEFVRGCVSYCYRLTGLAMT